MYKHNTLKNFVTGSTKLTNVSVCSSFKTLGYGKTCEVCSWPRNKFIVNDLDCLTSFFESDVAEAECIAVVDSHLLICINYYGYRSNHLDK